MGVKCGNTVKGDKSTVHALVRSKHWFSNGAGISHRGLLNVVSHTFMVVIIGILAEALKQRSISSFKRIERYSGTVGPYAPPPCCFT